MEPEKQHSGKDKEGQPVHQNRKEPSSLVLRIASSASGLAKEFGGSSSGNELHNSLASASSLSSKLQNGSSSSSPSTWTETFPLRNGRSVANGRLPNGHALPSDESFRSISFQHSQDQDFDDFLEGKSNFFHDTMLNGNENLPSWTGEFQYLSLSNGYYSEESISSNGPASSHHSGYPEYDDGAEVRMLLSDPDFMVDTRPADIMMEDSVEQTATNLLGDEYSPDEKRAADRIKESLPPPPVHQRISPDNPLNLKPEFTQPTATNSAFYQDIPGMTSTLGSRDESYMYFATQSEREHWVSEWDDVLNSYTDEVWGQMLPAVKEARSQLEEVKAGSKRLDNNAVTRLRMILGHVAQSANSSLAYEQTSSLGNSSQALRQQDMVESTWGNEQENFPQSSCVEFHRVFSSGHAASKEAQLHSSGSSIHNEMLTEKIHRNGYKHEQRKDSSMMGREVDDEISIPEFHCPWVSCHQASS